MLRLSVCSITYPSVICLNSLGSQNSLNGIDWKCRTGKCRTNITAWVEFIFLMCCASLYYIYIILCYSALNILSITSAVISAFSWYIYWSLHVSSIRYYTAVVSQKRWKLLDRKVLMPTRTYTIFGKRYSSKQLNTVPTMVQTQDRVVFHDPHSFKCI